MFIDIYANKLNGPGITPDDLDHIFEPFYSRKTLGRSGTGLGLTVVWSTIHEHNGVIQVSSDSDGTCFCLYLPTLDVDAAQERLSQKTTPDELAQGNGELILIVDDEHQQRDITGSMLSTLGYKVETACSGEEALEMTRTKKYDLLLLDMIMGRGMNGSETFQAIQKRYPRQKAVILSGYSQSKEVDKALAAGAIGILKKPITIARLSQGIQSALDT